MGLAASQARFLAITSRKAYCEFESMQIAQDKLSVTRELANATTKYQNSLDATKLVWDFDDGYTYDLSYGLLMTPSVVNNYNPYLITDRTGKVVLNSRYAAAAEEAGILKDGSTGRDDEKYKTFLAALKNQNIISTSTYNDISNIDYNSDAGYGAEPMNKNGANVNNIIGLAYQLKDVTLDTLFTSNQSNITAYKDKTAVALADISFSDVLTGNVVIVYNSTKTDKTDADNEFTNLIDGFLSALTHDCSGNTDIDQNLYSLLGVDSAAIAALDDATTAIDSYYLTNTTDKGKSSSITTKLKDAAYTNSNNGIYTGKDKSGNYYYSVNLSTLMSYFLTEFECRLNGYGNGYSLGSSTSASSYVTDDLNYTYIMNDSDAVASTTVMIADYYQQLYNNLCVNGWTTNDDVDDPTYLENALKNGTYFITSLSDDGYFYQNRYNATEYLVEVTDEDAIARAEAEYTSMKVQLDYKEEKLDLEMTNLDTEISSLTTEYDTVKNLISQNVQKVFTMFQ